MIMPAKHPFTGFIRNIRSVKLPFYHVNVFIIVLYFHNFMTILWLFYDGRMTKFISDKVTSFMIEAKFAEHSHKLLIIQHYVSLLERLKWHFTIIIWGSYYIRLWLFYDAHARRVGFLWYIIWVCPVINTVSIFSHSST